MLQPKPWELDGYREREAKTVLSPWEFSFFDAVRRNRILEIQQNPENGDDVFEMPWFRLRTSAVFWKKYLEMVPSKGRTGGEMIIEPFPELVEIRMRMIDAVRRGDHRDKAAEFAEAYRTFAINLRMNESSKAPHLFFECNHIASSIDAVLKRDELTVKLEREGPEEVLRISPSIPTSKPTDATPQ